jgi:hypothetical protein
MTIFRLQQHDDVPKNRFISYFPLSYEQFIIQFQLLILN